MNEKILERKLKTKTKKLGCLCLKFTSPGQRGVPDRIILLPGGKVRFAEIKTPGQKTTPIQNHVFEKFKAFGFDVAVIDSEESLENFLKSFHAD